MCITKFNLLQLLLLKQQWMLEHELVNYKKLLVQAL